MLRAIYRAIIIGRTRSAAIYLANNLSERQLDRKSTRLNSSHSQQSRMPSSA